MRQSRPMEREDGSRRGLAERGPWPRWIDGELAVVAIGLAAGTVAIGGRDQITPLRLALLGAAVLPWIIESLGVTMPPLVFAGWVAGAEAAFLFDGGETFSLMLLILLTGRTAAGARALDAYVVAAASVAVPVIRSITAPGYTNLWTYWSAATVIAYLAGRSMRYQRQLVEELRGAQAELARRAASDERQRIARELHDVIAHSLTVTMLHLTAARLALETDPGEAAAALAEAERLGRQSLADVRRAVGVLRAGREGGTASPLPSAADIADLVDRYGEAGLSVSLDMRGDPSILSAAAGLAAYRIVQESLNNVVRHAPGARAEVTVEIASRGAEISVHDSGPARGGGISPYDGGGLGLLGMQERATLLGGTFRAGPDGPGWTVRCALPVGDDPGGDGVARTERLPVEEPERTTGVDPASEPKAAPEGVAP